MSSLDLLPAIRELHEEVRRVVVEASEGASVEQLAGIASEA